MTNHPEPVSQSLTPQQQPQYNLSDRDKQLLFSEYNFEDLSASFRSLYKSVFEQSLSQQGEFFNTSYCNFLLKFFKELFSHRSCYSSLILEHYHHDKD